MKPRRFLILCRNDWMAPNAGAVEHYVHQVFSRIAARGHYVAWLCAGHRPFTWLWSHEELLKNIEGIQLAYLGDRFFYPLMVHLFFSRLAKQGKLDTDFDAVISCINGRTPRVDRYGNIPVVPIVFNLERNKPLGAPEEGPVLAATEKAMEQVAAAGVETARIRRVPFAANEAGFVHDTERNGKAARLVAFDDKPAAFARAISFLHSRGVDIQGDLISGGPPPQLPPDITVHRPDSIDEDGDLCRQAAFSWCGEGNEWRALDCATRQIPAVCPRTAFGEEFVIHEETGLLCTPGSSASLADAFERLLTDPTFRGRLALRAWERSRTVNWDSTAQAILDVLLGLP